MGNTITIKDLTKNFGTKTTVIDHLTLKKGNYLGGGARKHPLFKCLPV